MAKNDMVETFETKRGKAYKNESHFVVLEQGNQVMPDCVVFLENAPLSVHLKEHKEG